jgi:hypothetical protein
MLQGKEWIKTSLILRLAIGNCYICSFSKYLPLTGGISTSFGTVVDFFEYTGNS